MLPRCREMSGQTDAFRAIESLFSFRFAPGFTWTHVSPNCGACSIG